MDKQKADEVLINYLPKIYGFSLQKAFSYDEAEEICAEIVKELYESLIRLEEIVNLPGYIWRISTHVYAKYVSSRKKHQGVSIDETILPFEDTYHFGEEEEEFLRLRREITFLTKTRREVVYAYYYENKSIAVISKQQGIPIGTVKWHLNKARLELREGLDMERKIGALGLKPIKAIRFGHDGDPGPNNEGSGYYLKDSLNLNIVYSVYFTPRTTEEIAEELGVTPVFIEDKIKFLEDNGFLVRKAGNKFTTYVKFDLPTYSREQEENKLKTQMKAAQLLVDHYVDLVRQSISDCRDVYIPSNNREVLEAAAIFYGVANKCRFGITKNLSKYIIKTTAGGKFIADIETERVPTDPEYVPTLHLPPMWSCGNMHRESEKYPLFSWSIDSRYSSRTGTWKNNLTSDYEYLYEFMTGAITDNPANAEKFKRLRERQFLSEDNHVNIMVMKEKADDFFEKIPEVDETITKQFADAAFEYAQIVSQDYPPQMRDLIICWKVGEFGGNTTALMVMDILYGNGTFRPLTEQERITSNLILFTDVLPSETQKYSI